MNTSVSANACIYCVLVATNNDDNNDDDYDVGFVVFVADDTLMKGSKTSSFSLKFSKELQKC